jgi:hypothetical protein
VINAKPLLICPKLTFIESTPQIAREPLIMKICREAFYERATLTVRPTKQGMKVIDEAHDCYALKFVRDKRLDTLKDDQWLRLIQVELFLGGNFDSR